jgi:hypothetical protein
LTNKDSKMVIKGDVTMLKALRGILLQELATSWARKRMTRVHVSCVVKACKTGGVPGNCQS